MALVVAFGGEMKNIAGVSHAPALPVGDVLGEAIADLRVVANHIVLAE